MEGRPERQKQLFAMLDVEDFIPKIHPLRHDKRLADEELRRMRPMFKQAYSHTGRPSIPPEQLIKALLLQVLYSIRSERQLCTQIRYDFLFRWFVDLPLEGKVWSPTTFTMNRERFVEYGLIRRFFEGSVAHALMENQNGLLMDIEMDAATGTAERERAERLLRRVRNRHHLKPKTVAGDKGDHSGEFLHRLETDLGITPHVAFRDREITGKTKEAEARRRCRSESVV
jgi:transposase